MVRSALPVLAAALIAPAPPSPAPLAMISATPSADSVSRGAPSVAELVFSADISPGQSGIDVRSQNGARFDQHNLHTVGDAKHIAVGLRLLNPGHYTVRWHATGVAGQHVAGSYGFYVTAGS